MPNDAYPNVDKIGHDKSKPPLRSTPRKLKSCWRTGYKGEEIAIESAVGLFGER